MQVVRVRNLILQWIESKGSSEEDPDISEQYLVMKRKRIEEDLKLRIQSAQPILPHPEITPD